MAIKFYSVTDIESKNPELSNNGGDYFYGRTIAVENGAPFAVYFWTSAEFDYCPRCGRFQNGGCGCDSRARDVDFTGWENGEDVTTQYWQNRIDQFATV